MLKKSDTYIYKIKGTIHPKKKGKLAQLIRAMSWYAKAEASIPGEGTYKNQPMNAQMNETINLSLSFARSLACSPLSLSFSLSLLPFFSVSKKSQFKKCRTRPWLVWLSRLSASLRTKGLQVRFPVRSHAWVVGQVPSWGCMRVNRLMYLSHIDVSLLSLSPSPPLSLKINK